MLSFVWKYAKNFKYSQNGEEGILMQCLWRFENAGISTVGEGKTVEIGGNDGLYCSNTAFLIEYGYAGLFVEYEYDLYLKCKANWANNPRVRSQCSRVDEHNINAFVDDSCDVLSLDTDGSDYRIFKGLKAKPKIVIIEIDSSIPPDSLEFNSDGAAGYASMVKLGLVKGYTLLCHTGNLVFISDEYDHLFPEINHNPLTQYDLHFNRSWLKEEAA